MNTNYGRDALALALLVLAVHWLGAAMLPVRGEEPLRATIGLEMLRSGDWIVPRVQGEPLLSRPPLHNWMIAASCAAAGPSAWAIRFPSLLAALLTVLLVHAYAAAFLPRIGALAAGAACATFAEMFTTYAQAETEAVFILLVAASLLVWHHGFTRGWPDLLLWPAAWSLVALAMLAKGPQPPVYFVGSVAAWLLLTGQLRKAFTLGHLAGIALAIALVAAWWIPCARSIGWGATWTVFAGDAEDRFRSWTVAAVLEHLAVFPVETFACTLPWSPLLLLACRVRLSGHASFAALACGLAFLTIWIPPAGRTRFYAPLYPLLAVLVGAVLAALPERRAKAAALAAALLALLIGLGLNGARAAWLRDPGHEIVRIKATIPPGTRLVSIGRTRPLFAYHFGDPIEVRQVWEVAEGAWFVVEDDPQALPFAWERIGTITLDRQRRQEPEQIVVLGRRLPD